MALMYYLLMDVLKVLLRLTLRVLLFVHWMVPVKVQLMDKKMDSRFVVISLLRQCCYFVVFELMSQLMVVMMMF